MSPLALLEALVRAPSVAADEGPLARHCAGLLEAAGLSTALLPWHQNGEAQTGREQLIARTPGQPAPLTFTGHLDTVPADPSGWSFSPWDGGRDGDRMLGRGTSDMKSGVAALVSAVAEHARGAHHCRGVQVVLTAGEETGCTGALELPGDRLVPGGPLLVAEPTANRLVPAHKGAFWLRLTARGRAAHGSAPHLGDNAAVRLARAAVALHDRNDWPVDPRFGPVTANVGYLCGGTSPNVVPDRAQLLLDLRTVPGVGFDSLRDDVTRLAGEAVTVEDVVALPPIDTPPDDPFVALVAEALSDTGADATPQAPARFFTDASALRSLLGASAADSRAVPTVILGPGEPEQCHVVDEWCSARRVEEAVAIYGAILGRWCSRPSA